MEDRTGNDPATAGQLARGLWALGITLAAVSVAFMVLSWSTPPPEGTFGFRGFAAIFAVAFGTVGALIAARQPRNPIGWLLLGIALVSGIQSPANEYAIWGLLSRDTPAPLALFAAWFPAWIWIPATSGAMFGLFLFPNGRLLSRRWRWAVAIGSVGTLFGSIGYALAPGPLENFNPFDNPYGVGSVDRFAGLRIVGLALYGAGFLLACASVVLRFRRSTGDVRQQMRWLVAAGAFLSVTLVSSFVGQPQGPGTGVSFLVSLLVIAGFMSLPVAMGFAILKYRLYDLDIVIRKTVVFGILVVLLTAIFLFAAAAVGGRVARPEPGSSALPALLVAFGIGALLVPLWRLARRVADRVVFGGRASPYEVLATFADRVGGTYSADDVLDRMAQVLGTALGSEEAGVWLWIGDRYRVEATWPGESVAGPTMPSGAFEIRHQGELLGALAVRQPPNDPMNPSKEKLARDLAAQAGPVLRNVRLLGDLRESRRRIVAAQDERARKLERDIHDGAQQQLVALAVKQRLAASLVGTDDEGARALLDELRGETQDALEHLRDLARGIYPPLLADEGLGAAMAAQARKAPFPVTVDADGVGRFAPDVEATVYFCVLEALQNVAKYADATSVSVGLRAADAALRFEVTDDGRGFDPEATSYGTGLQGMTDRLEAIGGSLEVRSAPGEGTTLVGHVTVRGPVWADG